MSVRLATSYQNEAVFVVLYAGAILLLPEERPETGEEMTEMWTLT